MTRAAAHMSNLDTKFFFPVLKGIIYFNLVYFRAEKVFVTSLMTMCYSKVKQDVFFLQFLYSLILSSFRLVEQPEGQKFNRKHAPKK